MQEKIVKKMIKTLKTKEDNLFNQLNRWDLSFPERYIIRCKIANITKIIGRLELKLRHQ